MERPPRHWAIRPSPSPSCLLAAAKTFPILHRQISLPIPRHLFHLSRLEKMSVQMENEKCRICANQAHGMHFGVPACRACAAFFRRTIALDLKYSRCDRECNPTNGWFSQTKKEFTGSHSSCRACRFQRCQQMGMNSQGLLPAATLFKCIGVQLFRDRYGKRKTPTQGRKRGVCTSL